MGGKGRKKRKTFPDRIKAKFAKELHELGEKRQVQKWKTSVSQAGAAGRSRLEIRDAYGNWLLPEPDTEVDGLMPLAGIDLIGVDWEMPSTRRRLVPVPQAILRLQFPPTAYT